MFSEYVNMKAVSTAPVGVLPQAGSLVALLALRGPLTHIPAATWPLEGALEVLSSELRDDSLLREALGQLPPERLGPDQRVAGVRQLLRSLTMRGQLTPEGSGWDARFTIDASWLRAHTNLYGLLQTSDRAAVDKAAQRLVAMATMLSKKFVA
jgi:hypothetical protein